MWYSFAPLLGLPTGTVTFVDLPYVIDSANQKEEAFRINCLLNEHRLLNAFYTYPGKYLRVYASPYQFQKVVMELRGEQLSLPDSLALHAARFHITGPEQANSVFTWKATAPSSTSEVSLQVPLQGNVKDVPEIQEALVNANVGAQIHGIVHVKSPDELIMPAMHFTVPASTADKLIRDGSLQLQNGRVQIMALQEVVDAPRWASKPINHISENPRQHFLNSHSGGDRVGQGRLCDIRGQDEYHQLTRQSISKIIWHKDDVEIHYLFLDQQAPYVIMTRSCNDVPELQQVQGLCVALHRNGLLEEWNAP